MVNQVNDESPEAPPTASEQRRSSLRRVAVSSGGQVLGTVTSGLITLVMVKILTSRLGAASYGQYLILLTYSVAAALIADLGLNGVTYREIALAPDESGAIIGRNLTVRTLFGFLAAGSVLILEYFAYPDQRSVLFLPSVVFAIDIVFTVWQNTLLAHYGARVRSEVLGIFLAAGRVLFFAGVLLAMVWGLDLLAVATSYAAGDVLTTVVAFILVQRAQPMTLNFHPHVWWQTVKMAAPLGVMQALNSVYLYVDSAMISLLASTREVAYYGLGFNLVTVVAGFGSMFGSSLVPGMSRSDRSVLVGTVERSFYVSTAVAVPIGVAGVVGHHEVVTLLGGQEFAHGATAFLLLSLSLITTFPASLLGYVCVAADRYRLVGIVSAAVLAVNVALNAALIPLAGATGAASALLVSETLSLLAMYALVTRAIGVRPRFETCWRPLGAGLLACAAGLAVHSVFSAPAIDQLMVEAASATAVYVITLIVLKGVPRELLEIVGVRR